MDSWCSMRIVSVMQDENVLEIYSTATCKLVNTIHLEYIK